MRKAAIDHKSKSPSLPKAPTGIQGLDEITGGGLPRGRPTLVCGSAGCGKTLLAMEFLVRGATELRRAGRLHGLRGDRRGTGPERPLARLRSRRAGGDRTSCWSDYVHVERSEIEETGEYDLEGLFVRLGACHRLDRRQAGRARHASRRSSAACPTRRSCAPSSAACSAGSRTRGSRPSSPASAARARSPGRASRSTSPTA